MGMIVAWSQQELDKLEELRSEGLSAAQIAKEIGRSRNTVLGKLHRQGNSLPRPKKGAPAKAAKASRNPSAKPTGNAPAREPFKANPTAFAPRQEGMGVTLVGLHSSMCKWPIGAVNEPELFFCGDATGDLARPYCAAHAAIAYAPRSDARIMSEDERNRRRQSAMQASRKRYA